MSGDNITNTPPSFGIKGISSPTNKPYGFYEAAEWTDLQGKFWMFGGVCNSGNYCDLWRYDPLTNQWTWMKGPASGNVNGVYGTQGIPSPTNNPGSRAWGCATWVDLTGNLWLFGGLGYASVFPSGSLADLWKYDVTTNEWTWMNGPNTEDETGNYGVLNIASPNNYPPGRNEINGTWVDANGNLWLYSGLQLGMSCALSDLWMYDVSTNIWTWKGGSAFGDEQPVYGTKGIAAATNTPGARFLCAKWKDSFGNFWMFGGRQKKQSSVWVSLNDLWKYDVSTSWWTWVSGTSLPNNVGYYGTKCISSAINVPSARLETRSCWTDSCNNFWLFGGNKDDYIYSQNANDLWSYNPSLNEWTWVNGSSTYNNAGHYGTLQVSSSLNQPPMRCGAISWMDHSGYLWMFGGLGSLNFSTWDVRNDVWRFIPDTSCTGAYQGGGAITVSPNIIICQGDSATLTASGGSSYSWSPSVGLSSSSGLSVAASPSTTTSYTVTTNGNLCHNKAVVSVIVNSPTVSVAPTSSTICSGDSTALISSGATTYSWMPATGLSSTTGDSVMAKPAVTTTYLVSGTIGNCTDTQTVIVNVNPLSILSFSPISPNICTGDSILLTVDGASSYSWTPATGLNSTTGDSVMAYPSVSTTYTVTGITGNCSATKVITVNVNSSPILSVSPTSANICMGNSISLSANGATSYSWTPPTGLSATSGANVTANPSSSILYTVTGIIGSCIDTQSVFVSVSTNLPLYAIPTSASICSGDTTSITASGAINYSWAPSTGLISSSGAVVNANPTTTITYTVTGTDNFGCMGIDTVTIIVNALPILIVSDDTTICNGETIVLTASGANIYTWQPGTGLSGVTGSIVSASPLTTTSYIINGQNSTTNCSIRENVKVTVIPTPSISINGTSHICVGQGTLLIASGADSFTWSPAGTLTMNTGDTVFATPVSTTIYSIVGRNGIDCNDSVQQTVTVDPLPVIVFGDIKTACPGETIQINAISTGTYLWSPFTGLSCVNCPDPKVIANTNTTYNLTVTDVNGCVSTDSLSVYINNNCGEDMMIPNIFSPNDDGINDDFHIIVTGIKNLSCTIYNRWGQKLYEWDGVNGKWDGKEKKGQKAPDGIYYYLLQIDAFNGKTDKYQGFFNLIR